MHKLHFMRINAEKCCIKDKKIHFAIDIEVFW